YILVRADRWWYDYRYNPMHPLLILLSCAAKISIRAFLLVTEYTLSQDWIGTFICDELDGFK
ncbi:MAG: hypothetical protein ABIR66_12740, partial [Saprospiraceae bacterium]